MQNIHPMFVHFPLALLSVGLLFDALGYFLKKQSLSYAGWWCFSLGVVSAIVTVFTGMQAHDTVSVGKEAHEIMEQHEHFQTYSTIVFVGLLIWRSITWKAVPRLPIVYFIVTAIAVAAILYGAHYGGRLVYEYGVGTAVQPPTTKGENSQSVNPHPKTEFSAALNQKL